ncbi:MAG TPA: GIY-YIG nuclease family protein [Pyrinomonadaceae bacterium]|nr:GIY-YIG nuclease family protein [Pyrinomonadaceae bacterium]
MDRRQAKLDYKLSHRPMGVFQILNRTNGKMFVDSSLNIPGKIDRHRVQLNAGLHPSKSLQSDWLGEAAFDLETLESVEPRQDPDYDYSSDLQVLEDLWREKLQPYGDKGYNTKPLTRDERLRMIRNNAAKAII